MNRKHLILALVIEGAIIAGFSSKSEKPQQPNIVFVFADQLRSQEISCYGGVNIETPNLDRLTDEGKIPWLLFDNKSVPYQMNNLVNNPSYSELVHELNDKLDHLQIEASDSENTKEIYGRIIKENSKRQLSLDFREVNSGLL